MEEINIAPECDNLTQTEIVDQIAIVTMNDPRKANCLSSELVGRLLKAFDEIESTRGVRAIILRAQPGAKVWSAGHNIRELAIHSEDPLPWNRPFEKLLHRIRKCPVPVIGMIEGSVWGGACDLAMTCDLLVGTPSASFAITPARIGLSYNAAGLTHFLGVLPLHIIKEMLFTAEPLSAQDAHRLGLLNRLVEPDQLEAAALKMARDVAGRAPMVVRLLKAQLRKLTSGPTMNPDDFEEIQTLRGAVDQSQDLKEGVNAFFERRIPVFEDK